MITTKALLALIVLIVLAAILILGLLYL